MTVWILWEPLASKRMALSLREMPEFGLFDKIKISVLEKKTNVKICKEMCWNKVELLYRCRMNERKNYKIGP